MKHLTFISVFLFLFFTSCDKCKDVTCENGGECVDGTCQCDPGFSGESCQIEDKCISNAVTCENDGECEDGECNCTEWYKGESCEDKVIDDHIGLYSGTFNCSSYYPYYAYPYIYGFSDINEENKLEVEDKSNPSLDIVMEAEFTDAKNFKIAEQSVDWYNNENVKAEGTGSFTSAGDLSMTIIYSNSTSGTSTSCTFSSN